MAEEQNAGGQNLWLLLVSLGLGLIVVVIYNVHIWNVRNSYKGQQIELISLARDVDRGERLRAEDLEVRTVPKQYQESLGTVVMGDDLSFAIGQQVNTSLEKGRWLLYDYITGGGDPNPVKLKVGHVAVGVTLDTKKIVGDILHPNDRVNVFGSINGRMYWILKGVTVLAVGGGGDNAKLEKASTSARAPRSYNSITIELREEVALQLQNLLTHVNGSCGVVLRKPGEMPLPEFGIIPPDLKQLAESAAAPARGELPAGASGGRGGGTGGGTDGVPVPGSKTWE